MSPYDVFEESIFLDCYKGPFKLFLQLIQKEELEILPINLYSLTSFFYKKINASNCFDLENRAETFFSLTFLLWIKSKKLLPKSPQLLDEIVDDVPYTNNPFESLVEYYQVKQTTNILLQKQEEMQLIFYRPDVELPTSPTSLGVEHLSIADLAQLFQRTIEEKSQSFVTISEEEKFTVSDKMNELRRILTNCNEISLLSYLEGTKTRYEFITIFLALLELIKLGEITVLENSTDEILIKWK